MDDEWDDPLADPLFSPAEKTSRSQTIAFSAADARSGIGSSPPTVAARKPQLPSTPAPGKPAPVPTLAPKPKIPGRKPPVTPPKGQKPQIVIRRKTTAQSMQSKTMQDAGGDRRYPKIAPRVPGSTKILPKKPIIAIPGKYVKNPTVGPANPAGDKMSPAGPVPSQPAPRVSKIKLPKKLVLSKSSPNLRKYNSMAELGVRVNKESNGGPAQYGHAATGSVGEGLSYGGQKVEMPLGPGSPRGEATPAPASMYGHARRSSLGTRVDNLGLSEDFSSAFKGGYSSHLSSRLDAADDGFSLQFKTEFFQIMDSFPTPPAKSQKVSIKRMATAPALGTGQKQADSARLTMHTHKLNTDEDEVEKKTFDLMKRACSGESYEPNVLIDYVHKLSLSDFKVFQDRVHDQIIKDEPGKKGKNLKAETGAIEVSTCILQFGMEQKVCRLNQVMKDNIRISYRGKSKLNFKFLPIPNMPGSVKMTFTPASGVIKKKSTLNIEVELVVSATVSLKTIAILDIAGVLYMFLIEFKSENSQFGIEYSNLDLVDDYGYKVPRVLVLMKNHLYKNGGLYQESIFRLQPDQDEMREALDDINKGSLSNSIDTHVVANLIKQWFRDYPGGILNSILKPKFDDVDDEANSVTIFNTLPEVNKTLMLWLLDLLADVAAFDMDNKMSTKNLAIVFAPHLYPNLTDSSSVEVLNHSRKVANFLYNILSYRLRERYSQD